jgi:hypothetical protein
MAPTIHRVFIFATALVACSSGSTDAQEDPGATGDDAAVGAAGNPAGAGGTRGGAGGSTAGAKGTGGAAGTAGTTATASGTGPWVPVDQGGRKAFYMFASPNIDRVLYWDSGQKKLFASTDKGTTWTALAAVSSGAAVDAMMQTAIWDPADPTDQTFWIGGMYGSAGVYHTTDGGATFSPACFAHTESFAVDISDPARKTLLASDHGGGLALSTDGGVTCDDALPNVKAADATIKNANVPYIVDSKTFLVSSWGPDAVLRTTDGAATWTKVSTQAASNQMLVAPDGTLLYGLIWDRGVLFSKNHGATWAQGIGYGTLDGRPGSQDGAFLADGRLAWIAKRTTDNTQQLLVSSDYKKFTPLREPFPVVQMGVGDQCLGVIYSKASNALYTWTRNGKISRADL